MWECNFAEESMDYKLFWIRFVKKIWLIFVATVLGALSIGGGYYVCNVEGQSPSYKIVSDYYLDYAEDSAGNAYTYFNYYTWSEIVNTDEFIMILKAELPEGICVSDEELKNYTDATIESDARYLCTTVITEQPDKTIEIARAMERAMQVFAKGQKELNSVKVVTAPLEADETYPDTRPVRAFVLGVVIGLFCGLLFVCILLISDNSVFLPHTMEKRYGIKAIGCKNFAESKNNIRYFCKNKNTIGFVGLGDVKNSHNQEILEVFEETLGTENELQFFSESVLSEKFDFDKLRKCDSVIFLVKAGAKNGKKIERAIEQINRQDVQISGAFLFDEDKMLIKCYYR